MSPLQAKAGRVGVRYGSPCSRRPRRCSGCSLLRPICCSRASGLRFAPSMSAVAAWSSVFKRNQTNVCGLVPQITGKGSKSASFCYELDQRQAKCRGAHQGRHGAGGTRMRQRRMSTGTMAGFRLACVCAPTNTPLDYTPLCPDARVWLI